MTFYFTRTSEFLAPGTTVEINSLEELMALQASCGEELIIGVVTPGQAAATYSSKPAGPFIEIYDDYRE